MHWPDTVELGIPVENRVAVSLQKGGNFAGKMAINLIAAAVNAAYAECAEPARELVMSSSLICGRTVALNGDLRIGREANLSMPAATMALRGQRSRT